MPPSAFVCYLPCSGGLEGEGRGMVVCPCTQPGGSPWRWKLAGDVGVHNSHPHKCLDNSVTTSVLVMKALCLCNLLLTPTVTLAIKPSKGISKICKIQQHLCEFSTFFGSEAARETVRWGREGEGCSRGQLSGILLHPLHAQ